MSPLIYFLKKAYYRNLDKFLNKYKDLQEFKYKEKYLTSNSSAGQVRICTYQTGFNRHYTRYFTSSDAHAHSFILVDQPSQAEVVTFINTIEDKVLRHNQRAILFFHEPLAYAHLYQSEINENQFPKSNLEVISHLPTPSLFLKDPDGIKFHRSIPYVHFHHNATYDQLNSIDVAKRIRQICSITSGLSGIPGYQSRRQFIESFSASNPNFDLYGKFSKFAVAIPSYRGPCIFKWKTVSQYKYSLVIENSNEDYYISEKIFDALICGSMPIYHGSDKIFEIIPKEWFYFLPSLDVSEISKLNAFIATDSYKFVSDNRAEICKTIYKKYSFYSALDKLLTNQPLPFISK
jgi:hypothetical protein